MNNIISISGSIFGIFILKNDGNVYSIKYSGVDREASLFVKNPEVIPGLNDIVCMSSNTGAGLFVRADGRVLVLGNNL